MPMYEGNSELIASHTAFGGKAPALPVGTRLRILPNHACATGAQHEGYNVVEGEREVLVRWKRFSGW